MSVDFNPQVMFIIDCPKKNRGAPRFNQKANAGCYSAAINSFFSRAALSRAKSSPAW